jgi:hypothetical protein
MKGPVVGHIAVSFHPVKISLPGSKPSSFGQWDMKHSGAPSMNEPFQSVASIKDSDFLDSGFTIPPLT